MKDKEIEIQVILEHTEPLLQFLRQHGEFKGTQFQRDEYFTPPHRNFLEPRPLLEWLRLRDASGKFYINYKHWRYDDTGVHLQYCDEYETELKDQKPLRKIFEVLNFKTVAVVEKKRDVWMYQTYEVAIDQVKGVGDFVEIEYKGEIGNRTPKEIAEEMTKFLKDLGCGMLKRNYQGYPFLLLFPKEVIYETI